MPDCKSLQQDLLRISMFTDRSENIEKTHSNWNSMIQCEAEESTLRTNPFTGEEQCEECREASIIGVSDVRSKYKCVPHILSYPILSYPILSYPIHPISIFSVLIITRCPLPSRPEQSTKLHHSTTTDSKTQTSSTYP